MGFPKPWILTRKNIARVIKKQTNLGIGEQISVLKDNIINEIRIKKQPEKFNLEYFDKLRELEKQQKVHSKLKKQYDVKGYVFGQLNTPTEKHKMKGNYKDIYTGFPPKQMSIYDGIRFKQLFFKNIFFQQ